MVSTKIHHVRVYCPFSVIPRHQSRASARQPTIRPWSSRTAPLVMSRSSVLRPRARATSTVMRLTMKTVSSAGSGRPRTSPNSVLTTGIELISSTSTSYWETRATPSLGKTATTLLPPSTIFTSCGVRFTILISPLSRVSAHSSAKYLQKSRKLFFAVREVAFS